MLAQRALIALLLLPIGIAAILLGGLPFILIAALVLLIAAAEYVQLFLESPNRPLLLYTLAAVLALLLARWNYAFDYDYLLLPLLFLGAMLVSLFQFERGRTQAANEFAASLSAIVYIGLLGGFALAIRQLDQGQWWLLLIFGAPWLADMGAYFIGRSFGRHKMLPNLSPQKSWQGYLGGVLVSLLLTPLYVQLLERFGMPAIQGLSTQTILIFALILSTLPPLGDFGISMIKRQFNVKHTGSLLREHGGMLDRLDSVLWAWPLGYLLIELLI